MTNEMMQIPLKYDESRAYCVECLKQGNTLANELFKVVSFKRGNFCAITPSNADIRKIHDFQLGNLLPENPLESVVFRGKKYPARKHSGSTDELAFYLDRVCKKNKGLSCVFEDVVHQKMDPHLASFEDLVAYFENEVFYYLNGEGFSIEKVRQLVHQADGQWYYMNVITTEAIEPKRRDLTFSVIESIALNTTHIILGAYDMEGYVCWTLSS